MSKFTAVWTLVAVFAGSAAVRAQAPGTRAGGMGTAFVAVADDASAVYWNPAGVGTGPLANVQLDFGKVESSPGVSPADASAGGWQDSARLIALGVPPLGLSYYRLNRVLVGSLGPAVPSTPDREGGRIGTSRLTTTHLGVTLLQSLGDFVTVGTTVKVVRGTVSAGTIAAGDWGASFDRAEGVEGVSQTRADLDAGVMVAGGGLRLGLVLRNLRQPEFGDAGAAEPPARLERAVRAGAAWGSGWPGRSALIVAVDADVTSSPDLEGERRDVAGGIETWWLQHRLGFRGGVRSSTLGETRTAWSAGTSIGITEGVFVDAQMTRGQAFDRGWGIGTRFVY